MTDSDNNCPSWVQIGECKHSHRVAEVLYCGRDHCSICGRYLSTSHVRRLAKLLLKIEQIKILGFLVIGFPDDLKTSTNWGCSKQGLNLTLKRVVNTLLGQQHGYRGRYGGYYDRLLSRWHWFTLQSPGKWDPRLNVLVNEKTLQGVDVEDLRSRLRLGTKCGELTVDYCITDEPYKMLQILENVTRPTFLDLSWGPHMAHELYGYHNTRIWGSWVGELAWQLPNDRYKLPLRLENNICPLCGAALTWHKPIHIESADPRIPRESASENLEGQSQKFGFILT